MTELTDTLRRTFEAIASRPIPHDWTESAPLLDYLYEHAARPEFQYRFQWGVGSIAFWDNRSTWHYAVNDYHGARRLMHRITIAGGPLE